MDTTDKLNALLQEMRGQVGLEEARRGPTGRTHKEQIQMVLKEAIRDLQVALERVGRKSDDDAEKMVLERGAAKTVNKVANAARDTLRLFSK